MDLNFNDFQKQNVKFDIDKLKNAYKDILKLKDNFILTTEKDYTKLRKFNIENLYYLPIRMEVSAEKTLMQKIEEKIG